MPVAMVEYESVIEDLSLCGDEVVTVTLLRPAGYRMRAGQWFRVGIATAGDVEWRTFSHLGIDHDESLRFVTRISSSSFKQALARLGVGDVVRVSESGGRLSLPSSERMAVLSGGVGIAPVRSMLAQAIASERRFADVAVFFGNRDESCEPLLEDLLAWAPMGVRVVRVVEHPGSDWQGERGFITSELIKRYLDDVHDRDFVVTGPPVMVSAMQRALDELGVESARRVVENFGPAIRNVQG